jgi:hypothetical protein
MPPMQLLTTVRCPKRIPLFIVLQLYAICVQDSTRNISTHVVHLYLRWSSDFKSQPSRLIIFTKFLLTQHCRMSKKVLSQNSVISYKVKIRLQSSWTQTWKYLLKSKNNSSVHIWYGNDKSVNHVPFSYGKYEITNIYLKMEVNFSTLFPKI